MRTAPALVVVTVALLALSGCFSDDDPIIPEPLPSATPIFASDEEALAAAEEAYAAYLAVTDLILSEGGNSPERLLAVATEQVYETESASFNQWADLGWHSVGVSTIDTVSLQSYATAESSKSVVVIYACNDVSNVDVLDAAGVSMVSSDRPNRTAFQLTFDYEPVADSQLILSGKEVWTGEDFCVL